MARLLDAVAEVGVAVFIVEAVLEATDGSDGVISVADRNSVTEGGSHGHHTIGADFSKHGEETLRATIGVEWDLQRETGEEFVVVDEEAFGAEGFKHGVDDSIAVGNWGSTEDLFTEVVVVKDGLTSVGEADGTTSLLFVIHVDSLGAVDFTELGEHLFWGEEAEDAVGLTNEAKHRVAEAGSACKVKAISGDSGRFVAGGGGIGDGVHWDVDGLDGGDEGGIRGGFHSRI